MAKISIGTKTELLAMRDKWRRVKTLIENDESKLNDKDFCLKLPNETAQAYQYRKSVFVTGFVNPTIELLTAPANTIYKNNITLDVRHSKNSRLMLFMDNVTLGYECQVSLTQFMNETVCPLIRGYGTVFILLDMPAVNSNQMTEDVQKENRIWPYVTMISPLDVMNYQYYNGELHWFAYKATNLEFWGDPLSPPPKEEAEIRIWTRTQYIRADSEGNVLSVFDHNWGFVPVIIQAAFKDDPYSVIGESPFLTSSRYIVTANNHLNTINMELWKYSNSLLMIHRESLCSENAHVNDKAEYTLKTIPDGSAFIWAGKEKPEYLIRDLQVIEPTRKQYELYMEAAIDNERSAKSVAKSGYSGNEVAKSGIALMIEKDPIIANITATALDCEAIHKKIILMADRIINDGEQRATATVAYDKNYDMKPFQDTLANIKMIVKDLHIPSPTLTRELFKKVADNEIKDPKLQKLIANEIDVADVGEAYIKDQEIEEIINGTRKEKTGDEDII